MFFFFCVLYSKFYVSGRHTSSVQLAQHLPVFTPNPDPTPRNRFPVLDTRPTKSCPEGPLNWSDTQVGTGDWDSRSFSVVDFEATSEGNEDPTICLETYAVREFRTENRMLYIWVAAQSEGEGNFPTTSQWISPDLCEQVCDECGPTCLLDWTLVTQNLKEVVLESSETFEEYEIESCDITDVPANVVKALAAETHDWLPPNNELGFLPTGDLACGNSYRLQSTLGSTSVDVLVTHYTENGFNSGAFGLIIDSQTCSVLCDVPEEDCLKRLPISCNIDVQEIDIDLPTPTTSTTTIKTTSTSTTISTTIPEEMTTTSDITSTPSTTTVPSGGQIQRYVFSSIAAGPCFGNKVQASCGPIEVDPNRLCGESAENPCAAYFGGREGSERDGTGRVCGAIWKVWCDTIGENIYIQAISFTSLYSAQDILVSHAGWHRLCPYSCQSSRRTCSNSCEFDDYESPMCECACYDTSYEPPSWIDEEEAPPSSMQYSPIGSEAVCSDSCQIDACNYCVLVPGSFKATIGGFGSFYKYEALGAAGPLSPSAILVAFCLIFS